MAREHYGSKSVIPLRKAFLAAIKEAFCFGVTRLPTTYETIRGANNLPKIAYTQSYSYKEKGRPEINASPGLCERMMLRAKPITHD